jgi:spermidine dehydrogenase
MDRKIPRRDFINGVAAGIAGAALPLPRATGAPYPDGAAYPPAQTGLGGSHPGAFGVAHELAWSGRRDWGRVEEADAGTLYDLVVVGAGISGLASAWMFHREHPEGRVLLLDNHRDFGGHAVRNEFRLSGKTVLGYGGAQALEGPAHYSTQSKQLLRDLGVELTRFETAYDTEFFRRHGLAGGTFFPAERFGSNRLVRYPLVDYTRFLPLANGLPAREAVSQMPLGPETKRELLSLLEADRNLLGRIPPEEQEEYLHSISYRVFLERHCGVRSPELFTLLQGLTNDEGASIEVGSALGLLSYSGLPGIGATALAGAAAEREPYIYHFPDGNASIARLLVRSMIPAVARGSTMDDVVLASFDYRKLDLRGAPVRIRLDSTVVAAAHHGDPHSAEQVSVTYVREGHASRVRARACIMACNNNMLPYICPELPAAQRSALATAVRSPIVYTNVLLRNWRAWEQLGIGFFCAPASYHSVAMLDFPVSMGGYQFSANPAEPVVVHMERFPKGEDPLAPVNEQRKAGRREMYATSFETIERATRGQLAAALSGGSFDPARDIAAITVNRWGHGYAADEQTAVDTENGSRLPPHVAGRVPLGRIGIANSDAGASATIDTAIDQAARALKELGLVPTT